MKTEARIRAITGIPLRAISMDHPWRWLAQGTGDLKAALGPSLLFGGGVFLISAALALALWRIGAEAALPALAGGFLLVGPLLVVGLYGIARARTEDKPVSLALFWRARPTSPLQLLYVGVALLLAFLAWIRIAQLLFALMVHGDYVPLKEFASFLLGTPSGLTMLTLGTAIGGTIAFGVFAISAISIPLLTERRVDAMTAMIASIEAVRRNFAPMLLWAWLIALLTAFGIATLFIGLIPIVPLIGYATWHAYRDLVGT